MKKILILTSLKTGSGHRASSNAIEKKLKDAGYDTKQLNTFETMGKLGNFIEESYIPLTTGLPFVYYIFERFSEYFPNLIHLTMYLLSRKKMYKEIKAYNPDLIISVQCMFTKATSRLLKNKKLDIPFYVGVIDLVNPPSVWKDKDADMSFVPTKVIRKKYIEEDIDEKSVDVNHTLVYFNRYSVDRKSYYEAHTPKTIASVRSVPLSNLAKEALKFEKEYQKKFAIESNSVFVGTKMENGIELSDYEFKDFIFLNRFGEVLNQGVLNKALRHIIEECNREIERETKGKCTDDDKLPRFSCHNLRHTYITRLCEANVNPRVIMEVAGHSTMDITMQIYTTISKDYAQELFGSLEGYMKDKKHTPHTPKIPHTKR